MQRFRWMVVFEIHFDTKESTSQGKYGITLWRRYPIQRRLPTVEDFHSIR